jgi:hypothetical protein
MNSQDIIRETYDSINKSQKVSIVAGNVDLVVGEVEIKEKPPTDSTKTNGSLVLAYTSGNLTTITKTIDGTNYQKTLTYDVNDNLETVSAWS